MTSDEWRAACGVRRAARGGWRAACGKCFPYPALNGGGRAASQLNLRLGAVKSLFACAFVLCTIRCAIRCAIRCDARRYPDYLFAEPFKVDDMVRRRDCYQRGGGERRWRAAVARGRGAGAVLVWRQFRVQGWFPKLTYYLVGEFLTPTRCAHIDHVPHLELLPFLPLAASLSQRIRRWRKVTTIATIRFC